MRAGREGIRATVLGQWCGVCGRGEGCSTDAMVRTGHATVQAQINGPIKVDALIEEAYKLAWEAWQPEVYVSRRAHCACRRPSGAVWSNNRCRRVPSATASPGHRRTSPLSGLSVVSSSATYRWRALRARLASSLLPFSASWDLALWPRRGPRVRWPRGKGRFISRARFCGPRIGFGCVMTHRARSSLLRAAQNSSDSLSACLPVLPVCFVFAFCLCR